jgi:hypothetical protein
MSTIGERPFGYPQRSAGLDASPQCTLQEGMSSLAAGETMLIVAQLDNVLIQTVITSTTALAVMREGNAGLAAW